MVRFLAVIQNSPDLKRLSKLSAEPPFLTAVNRDPHQPMKSNNFLHKHLSPIHGVHGRGKNFIVGGSIMLTTRHHG